MREVVGAIFQSLDGVMQAPGGPGEDPTGGWQMAYQDEVAGAAIGAFLEPPFARLQCRAVEPA